MNGIFMTILKMNATACVVIAVVIIARILLQRFPKKYSYALWSVAAFRLIFPFSFSSVFSIFNLFPKKSSTAAEVVSPVVQNPTAVVSYSDYYSDASAAGSVSSPVQQTPALPSLGQTVTQSAPDWEEIILTAGWMVWLAGMIIFLCFILMRYIATARNISTAVRLDTGIYASENVASPFVFGVLRPRIYVPYGLSETEYYCVIRHERIHIKRCDHIVRLFAVCLLAVHWFDPMVWIAYYMMNSDMEMSCDEQVLGENGEEIKRDYSLSLLSFAVPHKGRLLPAGPVSFGESEVEKRVKNILKYKKPAGWCTVLIILLCTAMIAGCASNGVAPAQNIVSATDTEQVYTPEYTDESLPSERFPYAISDVYISENVVESERHSNIRQAIELLDGIVIPAGGYFSFNGMVGERNEDNGFAAEKRRIYEQQSSNYEAGMIDVASLLCYAARLSGMESVEYHSCGFFPNLEFVNRKNHPGDQDTAYGCDAYVESGGCDYVFRNNREHDIVIDLSYEYSTSPDSGESTITTSCRFWGVDDGTLISRSYTELEVVRCTTMYLPYEEGCVDRPGQHERRIAVYELRYENGVEKEYIQTAEITYGSVKQLIYTNNLPYGIEYYIEYNVPDIPDASSISFQSGYGSYEEFWYSEDAQTLLSEVPCFSYGIPLKASFYYRGELVAGMEDYTAPTDYAEIYYYGISKEGMEQYIAELREAGFIYGDVNQSGFIVLYNAEKDGIGVQISFGGNIITWFRQLDGYTGTDTPVPKG